MPYHPINMTRLILKEKGSFLADVSGGRFSSTAGLAATPGQPILDSIAFQ